MEETKNTQDPFISAMSNEPEKASDVASMTEQKATTDNTITYPVDSGAETVVSTVAEALKWIGILGGGLAVLIGLGTVGEETIGGILIGAGIVALITGIISWAFLKLLVNISRNLFRIHDLLKKVAPILVFALLFVSCGGGSNDSERDYSILPVRVGDKWGYITPKGEFVVNPTYSDADYFFEGLARVEQHGKIGYIDKKGKIVIPFEYVGGTNFSEGMAFVTRPTQCPICIDKKGKELFQLDSVEYVQSYSEGLAWVRRVDSKVGFINTEGLPVIPYSYTNASSFSEGLASVVVDNKCGFINKRGEIVIEPKYSITGDFHEGLAWVYYEGQYGYINKKGEIVITPQFEDAEDFSEGLACVSPDEENYGYINTKGKYIVNPQYTTAGLFQNGLAPFRFHGDDGYLNKKGRIAINPDLGKATMFMGDYAFAKMNGQWGLINKKGKFVVPEQFESVKDPTSYYSRTQSNYYDATAFLGKLFETWKDNAFYGLNSTITVKDIRSSFKTTGSPTDSTITFKIERPKTINNATLTDGVFRFCDKVYYYVKKYYLWSSYNEKRYIDNSQLFRSALYIKLEGNAKQKGKSLSQSIAKEIASRLDEEYQEEGDKYIVPLKETHPGYQIWNESNKVIIRTSYQ